MSVDEAIKELEFLFEPDRYPSLKEAWEVIVEAAKTDNTEIIEVIYKNNLAKSIKELL